MSVSVPVNDSSETVSPAPVEAADPPTSSAAQVVTRAVAATSAIRRTTTMGNIAGATVLDELRRTRQDLRALQGPLADLDTPKCTDDHICTASRDNSPDDELFAYGDGERFRSATGCSSR
ncbi:hypothetical protein FTX61_19710 [Nitriliruptoraceae bacterium ZYF776]|nr:hypothetical protein [Profundirhabdus halotolerans]